MRRPAGSSLGFDLHTDPLLSWDDNLARCFLISSRVQARWDLLSQKPHVTYGWGPVTCLYEVTAAPPIERCPQTVTLCHSLEVPGHSERVP